MEELGYKEVNLNLGCPSGTVVSKKKGSGFLADLEGMKYFFDEVFSQVNIEVSVKTRLGVENPDEVIDLMNIYNAFPISEVIVMQGSEKITTKGRSIRKHLLSALL